MQCRIFVSKTRIDLEISLALSEGSEGKVGKIHGGQQDKSVSGLPVSRRFLNQTAAGYNLICKI